MPSDNDQAIYFLNIDSEEELEQALAQIGADPRAKAYLQPKRAVRYVYIKQADFRAASFLKQELLARGGDAAVSRHVIDASSPSSDVLLMATDGQLHALLLKLRAMNCWGLPAMRAKIEEALRGRSCSEWSLALPGGRELLLGGETLIMGILNVSNDSFYEASRVRNTEALLQRAADMLKEGAAILDLGAESTRPGATPLAEADEIKRLIPAVRELRKNFPDAVISADTYKGRTALAAAEAGADIINDVGGFELDGAMLKCAAQTGLPYVLSHIKGRPSDMFARHSAAPAVGLWEEMTSYFKSKMEQASEAGISQERIIVDPGLGFGKNTEENLKIIRDLETLRSTGRPLLVGHSRKRFIGETVCRGEQDEASSAGRLLGTVALSALMYGRAQIVRVHDVAANKAAFIAAAAVKKVRPW